MQERRICFTPRRCTTSRRSAVSLRTSARLPTRSISRSSFTTFRDARAATSKQRRRSSWPSIDNITAVKEASGNLGADRGDHSQQARQLHGSLGRRRADARGDGRRRRRRDLGDVERRSEACARVVELWDAATSKGARRSRAQLAPWTIAAFVESNPIPAKAALAMMGRMRERAAASAGSACGHRQISVAAARQQLERNAVSQRDSARIERLRALESASSGAGASYG